MNFAIKQFHNIPFDTFFSQERVFFEKNQLLSEISDDAPVDFYTQPSYFIIEAVDRDSIWLRDRENITRIQLDSKELTAIPLSFENAVQVKNIADQGIIIRNNTAGETWTIHKINFKGETVWSLPYNPPVRTLLGKEQLILSNQQEEKLEAVDLKNGSIMWQLPFRQLMPAEKITISNGMVEHEGLLYFILHSEEQHTCFGVDIASGKVLKHIPDVMGDIFLEDGFLYFLHPDQVQFLNTATGHMEKWEIEGMLKEEGLGSLHAPLWDIVAKNIYFSQSANADRYSGSKGAQYGILDPFSKKLLYKNQIPQEHGMIGVLKATPKHFYIQTQDETLFVLQRIA